jgi:hypothetical protein
MAILTREEAMEKLRLKPSFFSKIVNGKVKGLPRIPSVQLGRKQLFREESLNEWVAKVEELSCKKAH